ncbi:MAG TPA: MFS transporter [Acidobacteriaceae bacterium]
MSQRPRIFYGWWIVLVSVAGEFFGAPVSVYSFGIFLKPLVHEFHASRAAISFAFMLHNVVGALLLPAMGRLIDRVGARRVILILTAIFALALLSGLCIRGGIWQLYVFYTVLGITLSAGPGPVPYGVVISHWFNRRRGMALGLVGLGIGIGAIAIPLLSQRLIAAFGWRAAYAVFGAAMLVISLPLVVMFLRNDPSDCGLLADGSEKAAAAPANDEGLCWAEIWRSTDFWLMIAVFTLTSASMHAGVLHMPALLTDRGLSPGRAAMASGMIGISVVLGRVGSGYLLDRFLAPRVAMVFYGACAAGLAILWSGLAGGAALAAAFLVGLGMGSEVELMAYLVSRYFGLRSFATAYGYAFAAFMIAGAVGTLLMGAGFDHFHSYTVPLGCFCVAMVCALVLLGRLGAYRYGVESENAPPLEAVSTVSGG